MSFNSILPTTGSQGQPTPAAQNVPLIQDNSLINNMLHPEMIREILSQPVLSDGEHARTREVCSLWVDPRYNIEITNPGLKVFGPTVWKDYLGLEIEDEVPPPPARIVEMVKSLRESIKGQEEAPSCTLVLMPKGLTANKLMDLVKNPKRATAPG